MYRVEFHRVAKKELDSLPKAVGDRLVIAIARLRANPRERAKKLTGSTDVYRIRVGRYRVAYHIDEGENRVMVLRVARRTEGTYRGL